MTTLKQVVIVIAISLVASVALDAKKPRAWQRGEILATLVAYDHESTLVMPERYSTAVIPVDPNSEAHAILTLDLDGQPGDIVYVVCRYVRWRLRELANVAVNGTVHFYLQRNRLFLLDEDRKTHKYRILKRIGSKRKKPTGDLP